MALAARAKKPPSAGKSAAKRRSAASKLPTHLREVRSDENDEQTAEQDVPTLELPVEKVIVDRRRLRELRISEAASVVADKARGEQTMAEIKSRKGGHYRVIRVNPYDLHFEEGHNPRDFTSTIMRERVAYYAVSIALRGVRQALDVYIKNNTLFVNGGETRWRATLHAINFLDVAVEGIPVIISVGENETERMISQWLGNDGARFQDIEEAHLFRRYIDLGGDVKVFGQRIGRPVSYITERIKWLEMPTSLQKQVTSGVVAPRTAFVIWQESGENEKAAQQKLTQATEKANDEGVTKVRPRHVRAIETGETTKIIRSRPEHLAAIFNKHGRHQIIQWFGQDDAEVLFRAAKMTE